MKESLKNALVLIARQPKIRTVEIADRIDCDTEMVEPMLKPHIDVGHIVVIPVIAPNGRKANGFILTDAYRKTPEGREIIAVAFPVEPEATDEQQAAPAAAQTQEAPAVAPVEQAASPDTEGDENVELSKVELAIRYIKQNGSANGNQLRELLHLEKHQYPLAYLKCAVYSGRLRLDGGSYYIGDGTPATPRLKKPKARAAAPAKQADKAAKPKDQQPTVASVSAPAGMQLTVGSLRADLVTNGTGANTVTAPMRCAVWSDGQIELQRGGQLICALNRDEAATLAKFLADYRIAA